MSGISEIKLDNTSSNSNELKKIQLGKASGSLSPTATNSVVNKIDITRDTSATIGGTRPDRVVPMDDLSLLVDPSKTKSEPYSLSTLSSNAVNKSVPFSPTNQQTNEKPLFTVTKTQSTSPSNMTTTTKPSFMNETTDLSDILNKDSKTDFKFTPSINVSTNAKIAQVSVPKPSRPPSTTPSMPGNTTAPTPATAPSKPSFMSSLFGTTTPAPASVTTPTPVVHKTSTIPEKSNVTSNGGTSAQQMPKPVVQPTPIPRTQAEILKEKQDLLFKLNRLQKLGMPISQKYTMSSKLEDIKSEFLSLKAQRELQNSVKFQRKMMMAVVTGVEFINTKFDPFDIKLDGWSESVHENVNDYDEIFEELHDKYKEKAKMAPETKLFFSLAGSAFMFHLTQSLFKTSPAIGDVMQQNPELMKQFAQAAVNSQSSSTTSMPMPGMSSPSGPPMGGVGGGLGGLFSGLMGGMGNMGGGGGAASASASASESGSSYGESQIKRQQMNGPQNVDNILSQLSKTNMTNAQSSSRMASVTKADEIDIAQLGEKMRTIDTASSGYRKKLSDGIKLDL